MPGSLRAWHDGVGQKMLLAALIGASKGAHFRRRGCHSKDPHFKHMLSGAGIAADGPPHNPIVIDD
mgnify:CR=1 FL=1